MSRIPLIVAVVGALLVGGATTGTTRASWTDQASLQQHGVASGRMSYTATTPAGVTVDRVAGSTADTTFVLDDTSLGRNLTQRITASVATTPAGVTATIGTNCLGAASVSLDTTPTSADQTLCVRVTSSAAAVSGTVVIELSSAQRPIAGWTTTPISRPVAVTVNPFTCSAQTTKDVRSFGWSPVPGATGYTVSVSTEQAGTFSPTAAYAPGTTEHQVTFTTPQVRFFRVTATTASGTTAIPGALRMERLGNNGKTNMTCGLVTP